MSTHHGETTETNDWRRWDDRDAHQHTVLDGLAGALAEAGF
jgi:hypothetical protein